MNAVIQLEARKQRSGFIVALLLALFSMIAVPEIVSVGHDTFAVAIQDLFAGILLFGIPLAAILFPAAGALGLRNSALQNAEEPLPVSPASRVFTAYLVSLVYFALFAGIVSLAAYAAGSFSFFASNYDFTNRMVLNLLLLLHLHFLTFAFCYWLNLPLLGTAVAMTVVAFETYAVVLLMPWLNWFYWHYPSRWTMEGLFWRWVIPGYALSLIAFPAALAFLTNRVEHFQKLRWKSFLPLVALFCSCFALWGSLKYLTMRMETSLVPVENSPYLSFLEDPSHPRMIHGGLFQTANGSLVRIDQQGNRLSLYKAGALNIFNPASVSAGDLFLEPIHVNDDGSMWVLTADATSHPIIVTLLSAKPGDRFRQHSIFAANDLYSFLIFPNGKNLFLYAKTHDGRLASAPIPPAGKPPQWTIMGKIESVFQVANLEERMAALYQSGELARLSKDRTKIAQLVGGHEKTWDLPGSGFPVIVSGNLIPAAFSKNNESSFLVPVAGKDRQIHLLLCAADGSVTDPYHLAFAASPAGAYQTSIHYRPLFTSGSVWIDGSTEKYRTLLAVSADGHIYPPLDLNKLFQTAKIRNPISLMVSRLADSEVDMIADGRLLRANLNNGTAIGRPLELGKKNEGLLTYHAQTSEGIYFIADDRIRFAGWNGEIKDLGPATLN